MSDIITDLLAEWQHSRTFPAELQRLAKDPVKVDVLRMNWAERRRVFTAEDPNEALLREIPKRIFHRGSETPVLVAPEGEDIVKLLQTKIDPAVTKELLDILLAGEHDLENSKN